MGRKEGRTRNASPTIRELMYLTPRQRRQLKDALAPSDLTPALLSKIQDHWRQYVLAHVTRNMVASDRAERARLLKKIRLVRRFTASLSRLERLIPEGELAAKLQEEHPNWRG